MIMDLKAIKNDILKGIKECSERGLHFSVKWLAELNYAIKHVKLEEADIVADSGPILDDEDMENYTLAKSYFDIREYDRSAYFVRDSSKPKCRFLYFYATYLSIEKKKMDSMTDKNCPPDQKKNQGLKDLCALIKQDYYERKLDGYCLYLYAVILKKLDLCPLALDVFVESIAAAPLLWSSWLELALLIPSKNKLNSLTLPDHWIKQFFLIYVYLEQLNNDEALEICSGLQANGFQNSSFIKSQTAIVHHNKRDLSKAIETYQDLLADDPYRLDNMDTYSNVLYVNEMKSELADLAQSTVSIDKYRVETCCVIGNYYSLRSDHGKAVLYFQRALKLNPHYLSAWTLIGHEFMEMKNTNAAIHSYRRAIEINRRDYRAWYGLGQTYEILKMPCYSLYYYKQSQQLRPNDSRMLIALGETYERLEKIENALKCYFKACHVGDIEGIAIVKLAKLYDRLSLVDNAAAAYTEYCLKENECKGPGNDDHMEFYSAFQYLANYHLKKGQLDDAYSYAYKCLENEETKEQAKALLKSIAARRGEPDTDAVPMDETGNTSTKNDDTNLSTMDMILSPTY